MRRYLGAWAVLSLALAFSGCGKSEQSPPAVTTTIAAQPAEPSTVLAAKPGFKSDTPQATVQVFLEAVRTGNDEQAAAMISTLARQKTAALGGITPPASDTAKFTIGKVEFIGEDGARVGSVWTDVDEEGQSHSDEAVWVLRKEADGWRVAGVAAMVFPGEEPLLLNFEDPDDMRRKQEEVRNRMERAEGGVQEGRQAEQSSATMR
jgi:hypothetical protein